MEVVLGYLLFLTGLGGSSLAGYIDLKTTEIPDEIPLAMVLIGLLTRFGFSLFTGNWNFLLFPALIGMGFFLFGMGMYYTGQWGGGDAKILGALGVLIGTLPPGMITLSVFPFFLDLLINVFMVGAVYIIIYAIIISFMNRNITDYFFESVKGNITEFFIFISVIIAVIIANALLFWNLFGTLDVWPVAAVGVGGTAFYFLWKFLKSVEKIGFTRKINTKNLQEGDMLGEDIKKLDMDKKLIKGLTKEEVGKIRKLKKTVWIREGVRFGPVFPITMIATLFFGNLVFIMF